MVCRSRITHQNGEMHNLVCNSRAGLWYAEAGLHTKMEKCLIWCVINDHLGDSSDASVSTDSNDFADSIVSSDSPTSSNSANFYAYQYVIPRPSIINHPPNPWNQPINAFPQRLCDTNRNPHPKRENRKHSSRRIARASSSRERPPPGLHFVPDRQQKGAASQLERQPPRILL